MTILSRDIISYSVSTLISEVVSLTLDGWCVDQDNPGEMIGLHGNYLVRMYRDDNTVSKFKAFAISSAERPKLTRGETLAKARESKEAKRVAKLDTTTIQPF